MLVLSRRLGESIWLTISGPDGPVRVRVTVDEIHRGSVKLLFVAPLSVAIDREEIDESKRKGVA